jgi:hypothetical protein
MYQKTWRDKRTRQGLPARGEASPEWWEKYRREYYQRPEVKKRIAALMRKYRNDPELRPKHGARWILNHAIQSGRIKKMPCEICGETKIEGHHPDYAEPLVVVWLCNKCHRTHHAKAEGG